MGKLNSAGLDQEANSRVSPRAGLCQAPTGAQGTEVGPAWTELIQGGHTASKGAAGPALVATAPDTPELRGRRQGWLHALRDPPALCPGSRAATCPQAGHRREGLDLE